jgi:hypothetical protein
MLLNYMSNRARMLLLKMYRRILLTSRLLLLTASQGKGGVFVSQKKNFAPGTQSNYVISAEQQPAQGQSAGKTNEQIYYKYILSK